MTFKIYVYCCLFAAECVWGFLSFWIFWSELRRVVLEIGKRASNVWCEANDQNQGNNRRMTRQKINDLAEKENKPINYWFLSKRVGHVFTRIVYRSATRFIWSRALCRICAWYMCVDINYMIHISVHDFSICALRNQRQQQHQIVITTKTHATNFNIKMVTLLKGIEKVNVNFNIPTQK